MLSQQQQKNRTFKEKKKKRSLQLAKLKNTSKAEQSKTAGETIPYLEVIPETLQSLGVHVRGGDGHVVPDALRRVDVRVHGRVVPPVHLLHHLGDARVGDDPVLEQVVDELGVAAARRPPRHRAARLPEKS